MIVRRSFGLLLCAFAVAGASAPQRLALVVTHVVDGYGNPVEGVEVLLIRCRGMRRTSREPSPLTSRGMPTEADRDDCDVKRAETRADGSAGFPSVRVGNTTIRAARDSTISYLLFASKPDYTRARLLVMPHVARNDFQLIVYRTHGERMFQLIDEAQEAEAAEMLAQAEADMIEAVAMMSAEFAVREIEKPEVLFESMRYLAYLQLLKGDDIAARETLERLLERAPTDAYGRRTSGVLAVQHRDWESARAHFEAYLLNEPENADAHLMLGNLLLETGEIAAAVEHLEGSVDLDPNVPPAHRSLGKAYEIAERLDEAVKSLERYLELADDPPDAAQIQATIELLKRALGSPGTGSSVD